MKYLILALASVGLVACGNSEMEFGSNQAADSANSINKMGPPLQEAEGNPGLLNNYPCGNGGKKVQICHVPPGNPDNRHTLCIGAAAVSHHMDNHQGESQGSVIEDYLGACVADTPSEPPVVEQPPPQPEPQPEPIPPVEQLL